jgi:2-methylcitrate dehydratase
LAKTIVQRFAEAMRNVEFRDLDTHTVKEAKRRILDTLACAMGGIDSEPGRAVRQVARGTEGGHENRASLWGFGAESYAYAPTATLVNGTTLRYLDFNDVYFGRDPCHASGLIAPAWATAEMTGASGQDLITGVVVGYEIQMRLCDFAGEPTIWLRGWDHVTNIPYAAAGLAAHIMGLPAAKYAHAMAIAGIQGNTLSELRRGKIPTQKAFAEAKAASDGLIAAMLAAEGMTGSELVFEGDYGYERIVAGDCDFDSLVAPVVEYSLPRTILKAHAVESMTQALVQCAITLRSKVNVSDIEHIDIGMYDYAFSKPDWDPGKLTPDTRETADHSYPYCVSVALLDGVVGPEQFTDEKLRDPSVRGLMERTSLSIAQDLDGLYPKSLPGSVELTLSDGTVHREVVKYALGHPNNPIPDSQIEEKFYRLSARTISEWTAARIIDAVWQLDNVGDIRELSAILRGAAS